MALKVKGTRAKHNVKSFNCGSCGSPVEVKVQGHTLNVVCKSCHAIIDAKDPNFAVLQKITKQKKYIPYIPLNSRGKLKGKLWECTGFIVKSDSGYYWREYLLYNPYYGYRWLVEVDGHWMIFKKIYRAVEEGFGDSVKYKNSKFKMFNNGVATVRYVEGEFYWRIMLGDKTSVRDYISPPEALSVEATEYEENWALGYHIDGETIKKAFAIVRPPPMATGVGMIQPSPVKQKLRQAMKPMATALMVLFAIFILRGVTANNEIIFNKAYSLQNFTDRSTTIKTEEFEIFGRNTNVQILGKAPVYNSWVYLDALLVDADSQKGIPLPLEISYYRGSDWSEGSQNKDRVINNVPAGTYYLSLKLQKGPRPPQGFIDIILRRDVPISSNFFVAVILIVLGPIFTFVRSQSFEKERWSNSDYSPYHES